jgi:hypothetical protein
MALSIIFVAPAQNSPTESQTEKDKKKQELEKQVLRLLDEAINEAALLKLPQNRAIVYAIAGDLYWKFDEKRARSLFRDMANEILAANEEAEKEKKKDDDPFAGLWDFNGDARGDTLPMLAKHDADLALELLVQTRPAKLAEAMAKAAQPNSKQKSGMYSFSPDQYRIQLEIALEQQFAVMAAEQNPDKAVKLIKDSLAKGISWNVMPALQKIHKKDKKKASALADDIVRKIAETDLTTKKEDLGAAIRFLQYASDPNKTASAKEKEYHFTESQVRDLANKLADTFLKPSNSFEIITGLNSTMSILEKLAPEKAPLLKQRQTEAMKNLPPEFKRAQSQQKIWNPATTPEEILTELPNYGEYEKISAHQALANNIAQIEDESRAKKLIDQIQDEKARQNAAERYEPAKINRAVEGGKLEDAKKLISNLGKKKTQIQKLVGLAVKYHKKGLAKNLEKGAVKEAEEDLAAAQNLMKEARALANEFPEDEDELNDLMEVVLGYAVVKPDEAFRIFEPIVDQINDFVHASAILSKYNKNNRSFKKGELLMSAKGYQWNSLLLFRHVKHMQALGKADLGRMNLLADRFARNDAKTIVKLFMAQGFFQEENKDEDSGSGNEDIIIRFGE